MLYSLCGSRTEHCACPTGGFGAPLSFKQRFPPISVGGGSPGPPAVTCPQLPREGKVVPAASRAGCREACGKTSEAGKRRRHRSVVMAMLLTILPLFFSPPPQHRMHPEISQLLVPLFYKELRDHAAVLDYEKIKVGRPGGPTPPLPAGGHIAMARKATPHTPPQKKCQTCQAKRTEEARGAPDHKEGQTHQLVCRAVRGGGRHTPNLLGVRVLEGEMVPAAQAPPCPGSCGRGGQPRAGAGRSCPVATGRGPAESAGRPGQLS